MAYRQYAHPMVSPVTTADREHDIEAALDALDLARRRFVNVVGHELRTPVTTLRGLSEELIQATEDELSDLAPAILRSARRVESLLDALILDLQNRRTTRANDLWLEEEEGHLRLAAADISGHAILRRLVRARFHEGGHASLYDWKYIEFLRGRDNQCYTGWRDETRIP